MNRKQNSLMRFSRTERLAQLSEQEIVIEKKKREIQAKIEAQKKKETEEALRKLDCSNDTKINKPGFSKKSSWNREENQKNKDKEKSLEQEKRENLTNAFSNDGSFLDQFKKLSKTGLGPNNVDVQTLALARKREEGSEKLKIQDRDDKESNRLRREQEKLDEFREKERAHERNKEDQQLNNTTHSSPVRKPLDSNIQLQLPPPGVVQLVPQHQVQIVSLVQPVIQNSMPIVSPPPIQIPTMQPVVLNSIPSFTTNEIQLKAISSSPSFTENPQPAPPVTVPNMELAIPIASASEDEKQQVKAMQSTQLMFNQSPLVGQLSSIQPPLPITPQNIPPPSPMQVQNIPPPPPLPPKEAEQFPKLLNDSISINIKNSAVEKLSATLQSSDIGQIPTPPLGRETQFNISEKKEEKCKKSPGSENSLGYVDSIPLPESISSQNKASSKVSSALYDCEEVDQNDDHSRGKNHPLAEMVARCGDDVEDLLRNRNEDDPALRFLFNKNSKEYTSYRSLVLEYRKKFEQQNESDDSETECQSSKFSDRNKKEIFYKETSSKNTDEQREPRQESMDDCGATELQNADETTSSWISKRETHSKSKPNDRYQADNEEELPYYQMPETSKQDCFLPIPKEIFPTEKRNENRKQSLNEEAKDESKTEERRKRKRKSRWGDAIATSSTGQAALAGSNLGLQASGKLPTPKTTLLSQLTRSDPGLMQYARQTFGSINLSEEDWKKAEDHYKINLLYQDLVKKRAEIDKLERAGKFKYEYDSDEDVEGGTWEHKLRQQEMMATQLWAEELTRQAAGKHHIGDFLPPEELERFMEKYNAVKEGREPDLSDYKEFKLKEDNVGYRLMQKMGWNEGQGLGQDGSGITNPVNKATVRHENQGLGIERPDGLEPGDDEYDAYRKRMMLAYRFRPNPLNNPRRPYY